VPRFRHYRLSNWGFRSLHVAANCENGPARTLLRATHGRLQRWAWREEWGTVGDVDLDTVADELYALPPEDFTAARNDRAKQARAQKDRELAAQISSLRKPTMAAWVTNALVRSHPDEVNLLLELGEELREVLADIDGDELRELTRQRYQLVSALVQQARSLASSQGKRVTDEVAQSVRTTLEATLSDQESADAVAAGRLTDGLQVSGFSTAAADGSRRPQRRQAAPAAPAKEPESSVADLEAERQRRARKQAERDVDAAAKAAQRAEVAASRAQQRLDSAERDRDEASAIVDRLRSQLEEATAELDKRVHKVDEARQDNGHAQERVRQSDAELAQARTRLEQLSD
jgi:hypothetical protein